MGIRFQEEQRCTGSGYYRTSVWGARELVERLVSKGLPLTGERPDFRLDDAVTFKVTITIEKV